MMKRFIALAALAALGNLAHADTIAQWNFNDSNLIVDVGAGTAALVGGTTTGGFNSGATSSDPVQPGIGWSITTFAAQSTGDKTRGASFSVSTLGYEDITFVYDSRHSNTAPGIEQVQYSTDGVTFTDLASFTTSNATTIVFFNLRTADLSAISAVDNQATVTFRIVAALDAGSYPSSAVGAAYGTSGTWRFDMVTISGTPVSAVPEPGALSLLLAGMGVVAFIARRRRD